MEIMDNNPQLIPAAASHLQLLMNNIVGSHQSNLDHHQSSSHGPKPSPNEVLAGLMDVGAGFPAGSGCLMSSGSPNGFDDQGKLLGKKSSTSENSKKIRKPRYAFQTRSQVDILDDGYRWRKYGQKAVKNNKFPRSYYRCTHQGCNVKKQVQRLSKDEGVVVTTYEGIHSHSIEKSTDNFEHILSQMHIYSSV